MWIRRHTWKLKIHVLKHVLAILTTYMETSYNSLFAIFLDKNGRFVQNRFCLSGWLRSVVEIEIYSTDTLPWIKGSKTTLGALNFKSPPQDERANICGTSGSARQGFSSAPVKLVWYHDQILMGGGGGGGGGSAVPGVKSPLLLL